MNPSARYCSGGWLVLAVAIVAMAPAQPVRAQSSKPPTYGWSPEAEESVAWPPEHESGAEGSGGWLSDKLPRYPIRHIGLGRPLEGTSWLNRPKYAGWFMGQWHGDRLISGQVAQQDGFFGGYLFGYDLNHYWGTELRLSYGYIDIEYLPDNAHGGSTRAHGGSTRNVIGDMSLLYYPWGDSKWRPYASLGMGLAGFHFIARGNHPVDQTMFHLPWGFGLKYQTRRWLALRLAMTDNLAFGGNRLNTMNNWSLVAGVEVHWGSNSSKRYYPW